MLRVAETDLNMQLALDYQHREHSLVLPQAVVVNTRPIQIKKLFTYILLNTLHISSHFLEKKYFYANLGNQRYP